MKGHTYTATNGEAQNGMPSSRVDLGERKKSFIPDTDSPICKIQLVKAKKEQRVLYSIW